MVPEPAISVLIPAYNEARLLGGTLDSVHASFAAVGWPSYEIIVCDNNSTDDTAAIARANRAQVVFEAHNQIARARNAAAAMARGKWLVFLDADTLLNTVVLQETIAALTSGRVGAGGAVLKMDGDKLGWVAGACVSLWNRISVVARLAAGSYIYCEALAWRETGGFPEDVYASEEIWFSRKLKQWCRDRRVVFSIITKAPVLTSARKVHWYGGPEMLRQLLILSLPGALRQRSKCGMWYNRPVENNP